jgi:hypothetical protein
MKSAAARRRPKTPPAYGAAAAEPSYAVAPLRGASMANKRGGARPGAGRRAKFTLLQEWAIGGKVDEHIKRRVLRRIHRAQDEAFYKGNLYKPLIDTLYAVSERYVAPPGASLDMRIALTKEYRSKIKPEVLRRHLLKVEIERKRAVRDYVPPPLPAKTPDGIRDLAIRAMVRFLRRCGRRVPFETVNDFLEDYRTVDKRIREQLCE